MLSLLFSICSLKCQKVRLAVARQFQGGCIDITIGCLTAAKIYWNITAVPPFKYSRYNAMRFCAFDRSQL